MVFVQHSGKKVELLTLIMNPQPDNVKSHHNTTKGLYVYLMITNESLYDANLNSTRGTNVKRILDSCSPIMNNLKLGLYKLVPLIYNLFYYLKYDQARHNNSTRNITVFCT